jgi:ribonuclease R
MPPGEVEKLAKHCSETERRAARAERELIKVKLLAFLADKVGEEYETIITGVENFGIFCLGIELPVEGLIHISALDRDDFFDHDPRSFSLVGRRTGKQYRLGDRLRVRVANVDVDKRLLEFALADGEQPAEGPTKKQTTSPRRPEGRSPGKRSGRDSGGSRAGGFSGRQGSSSGTGKARRDRKKKSARAFARMKLSHQVPPTRATLQLD